MPFNPPVIEHNVGHSPVENNLGNLYCGPTEEEIAQSPAEFYYAEFSQP